jgi:hypothetical protein
MFGDSIRAISKWGHNLLNAAAVIHPDDPPPTITTLSILLIIAKNKINKK